MVVVPEEGANGVIVAQRGAFGGCSLYAKEGEPVYCYNLGLQRFKIEADTAIPVGEHQTAVGRDAVRERANPRVAVRIMVVRGVMAIVRGLALALSRDRASSASRA